MATRLPVITRGRFGNATAEQKLLWTPLYEARLDLLGSTGTIIPLGDTNHENSGRTTCTTVGEEAAVFTYSKDVTTWDTPPFFRGPGRIPILTFDGVDEEADSPDATYWTRELVTMSIGAWVNFTGGANDSEILSKQDSSANAREWRFTITSGSDLHLVLTDEDEASNATIDSLTDTSISLTKWVHVAATYDGSADASGINLYVDGALAASTDTDDGNFVSMRNKGGTVNLGFADSPPVKLFDGQMAGGPLGPFFAQTELSADAILRDYQLGRAPLDV